MSPFAFHKVHTLHPTGPGAYTQAYYLYTVAAEITFAYVVKFIRLFSELGMPYPDDRYYVVLRNGWAITCYVFLFILPVCNNDNIK